MCAQARSQSIDRLDTHGLFFPSTVTIASNHEDHESTKSKPAAAAAAANSHLEQRTRAYLLSNSYYVALEIEEIAILLKLKYKKSTLP